MSQRFLHRQEWLPESFEPCAGAEFHFGPFLNAASVIHQCIVKVLFTSAGVSRSEQPMSNL